MWYPVLVGVHAAAGGVALLAGCAALSRRAFFDLFFAALVGMEVFLAAAIAADWSDTSTGARVLFLAFTGLGVFMIDRAVRARRILAAAAPATSPEYIAHLGFTLVALSAAFVVILVLDLGAPIWAVVGSGVLVSVAGHVVLRNRIDHASRRASV